MFTRTKILSEGKTKRNWEVAEDSDIIDQENLNAITAFDNPDFTKEFKTKGFCSNSVTCAVFEMLRRKGIPVSFIKKTSDSSFAARKCQMIPLEVVGRRYAVGSYLKRHPDHEKAKGQEPYRFEGVLCEFFLKTTRGCLVNSDGKILVDGLEPKEGEEDPLIFNAYVDEWELLHPKKPLKEATLSKRVLAKDILPMNITIDDIRHILVDCFLAIEEAWTKLDHYFIDIKIELGVDSTGQLMIADVIDNDSWRLRTHKWEELSKEAFRQGEELSLVETKYLWVAELVKGFNP